MVVSKQAKLIIASINDEKVDTWGIGTDQRRKTHGGTGVDRE